MNLTWTTKAIDHIDTGTVIAGHFVGERPLKGGAGMLDWRLHGWLSRLLIEGRIDGSLGSTLLLPANRLLASRVILVGLGRLGELQAEQAIAVANDIQNKLRGLKETRATLAVPPDLPADRAARVIQTLARGTELEELTVVADPAATEDLQAAMRTSDGGGSKWQSI